MYWNRIQSNWKQFLGNMRQQWDKLSHDHLDVIAGKRNHLAVKVQESYGVITDEAEKQPSDAQNLQNYWQNLLNDRIRSNINN